MFRGKFLAMLLHAFEHDELDFHGQLAELSHPKAWEGWLEPLRNKSWIVYAKPPFGGPSQVLKYLARYTHRVAISNRRLVSIDNHNVTFTWKNYAQDNQRRVMTLAAHEFLRRFLLHVLPSRFTRIRYYGFLANRNRNDNIHFIRQLILEQKASAEADERDVTLSPQQTAPAQPDVTGVPACDDRPDGDICPQCKQGRLVVFLRVGYPAKYETSSFDSS